MARLTDVIAQSTPTLQGKDVTFPELPEWRVGNVGIFFSQTAKGGRVRFKYYGAVLPSQKTEWIVEGVLNTILEIERLNTQAGADVRTAIIQALQATLG